MNVSFTQNSFNIKQAKCKKKCCAEFFMTFPNTNKKKIKIPTISQQVNDFPFNSQ